MNRGRSAGVVAAIAFVALLGMLVLQYSDNRRLRSDMSVMAGELTQLRHENERLKTATGSKESRSTDEQREILKLRNRIAELGRELRQNLAETQKLARSSDRTAGEAEYKCPFLKTAITNRVPNNETLVVGGWTSPSGKRAFLFVTPAAQSTDDAQQGIKVRYVAVQADESFWEGVGWGALKSDGDSSVTGLLTPQQGDSLLAALKQTKEAEVSNVNEPLLREGDHVPFAWSTADDNGATLLLNAQIHPRLTADRQFIDLEIRPAR